MRKVLVLAYHFPPQGGSGTIRAAKFCKYLPEFGWEAIVVTTSFITHLDQGLLDDLPFGLQVHRTYDLYLMLQRLGVVTSIPDFSRVIEHTESSRKISSQSPQVFRRLKSVSKSALTRMLAPDINILSWAPFSYRCACQLIERNQIEAVFTTSPPHSVQLVGHWLKRRYPQLPWIMDLRDLWSQSRFIVGTSSYQTAYRQERQCLQSADRVLVVTEGIRQLTLIKFPGIDETRILTLTNGFDFGELEELASGRMSNRFTITHVGTWYESTGKDPFISVLQKLAADAELSKRIQFRFIGYIPDTVRKELVPLCSDGFVVTRPPVPYGEALVEIRKADIVLLKFPSDIPDFELSHSNKLFDYLGCGKMILAVIPSAGEAARLIQQENAGIVVSPDTPEETYAAILSLLNRFEAAPTNSSSSSAKNSRYHRRSLTKVLAKVLDECAGKGRS